MTRGLNAKPEHFLLDIIGITICAVICGADSWVDIENYGKAKLEWLKEFLALPNGVPDHDPFARVLARLDPEQLQQCFLSGIQAVSQLSAGQIIAVDGKALRHSSDTGRARGAIDLVSTWACQNHLVLGQVKVDDKQADYVLALKANQGNLYEDVVQLFD